MNLGIYVTLHPSRRAHFVKYMLPWIRLADPVVSVDTGDLGVWPHTARVLWQAYRREELTHVLLLQDDLWLCRGFLERARAAVAAAPNAELVSLYANRAVIADAHDAGCSWCVIPDGAWGPALVWPRELIPSFYWWQAHHVDQRMPNYDSRVGLWCIAEGRWVWCTVPSLADHAMPGDSLVGHPVQVGKHPRVATRYYVEPGETEWAEAARRPWVDTTSRMMQYKWEYLKDDAVVRADGRAPWRLAERFPWTGPPPARVTP